MGPVLLIHARGSPSFHTSHLSKSWRNPYAASIRNDSAAETGVVTADTRRDPYQEMLDDPSLPFEQRWELVDEIDDTNRRFGVYRKLLKEWDAWMGEERAERFSLFEVGSGSWLSREPEPGVSGVGERLICICTMHRKMLNESLKKSSRDAAPQVHVATPAHLAVYPERSYDHRVPARSITSSRSRSPWTRWRRCCVSLTVASSSSTWRTNPVRCRLPACGNRLHGVSTDLSSDGIKSLYRSMIPAACSRRCRKPRLPVITVSN